MRWQIFVTGGFGRLSSAACQPSSWASPGIRWCFLLAAVVPLAQKREQLPSRGEQEGGCHSRKKSAPARPDVMAQVAKNIQELRTSERKWNPTNVTQRVKKGCLVFA